MTQQSQAPASQERQIAIYPCPFGKKFVVTIEPRTIAWPSKDFRSFEDANKHAQALRAQHGWSVLDKTGRPSAGELPA